MITVYGIKNCDTCRKALRWLRTEGVEHRFHDFRADGLDRGSLETWVAALGWETLLNRRGTTWRNLPDAEREAVGDTTAADLMTAHPTLIKRPVFDLGGSYLVGFKDAERRAIQDRNPS